MVASALRAQHKRILPWLICSIGMLFYFYNLFLRVSPSVMKNELMAELNINAFEFGSLAAFYYYSYVLMQLPAGILYDKFGARFVQFFAILIAVSGLNIFIVADTFWMVCCGRFLIGLGGAFAYIGVLKLASNWLSPNRFALATGLTTTFGMSAAIFCDLYLSKAVHQVGYKSALIIGLVMGLTLSIIVILFMRSKPKHLLVQDSLSTATTANISFANVLAGLKSIFCNRQMWLVGVIACLTYLPASVFLDLWGISYLREAHALSAEDASFVASMTFVGWIIGGPIIGFISDKIKRRRLPLIFFYILALIVFSYVFYKTDLNLIELYIGFFIIGVACSSHLLCFAIGKENNPLPIAGTAVAFTNCLTMLSGVIFQPFVGKLLDWHASFAANNSSLGKNLIYSGADYTYALSIIPLGLAIAILLSFFLKETYGSHKGASRNRYLISITIDKTAEQRQKDNF